MRLSELAKTLNTPVQELMGRAKKSNLKINHDTQLTAEQIAQLKKVEEQPIIRPQLSGQSIPEQPLQSSKDEGAIKQSPESVPDIATVQQTALSQAVAAQVAQRQHILQTQLQQDHSDGLYEGVVRAIVRQKATVEGMMLVNNANLQADTARRGQERDFLTGLLAEDSDFLPQNPVAQSYCESAKIGAASDVNVMQIIKNLHNS